MLFFLSCLLIFFYNKSILKKNTSFFQGESFFLWVYLSICMIRAGGWVPCYRVKKVSDLFQNLSITPRLCLLSISLSFFLSLPLFLSFPLSLSLFFSFTHTLSLTLSISLPINLYHIYSSLSIFFLCQSIYSAPFVKRILFQTLSLSLSLFFTLPYPYPSFSSCLSPKTVQKRHYLSQDRRIFYSNIFLFCN